MASRGNRNSRSGFTLIELMIAGVIMVVAVMTTMATQVRVLDLVKTTRETNLAMADLQAAMEQLMLVQFDNVHVAGSVYADGQAVAAFNGLHLTTEAITCDYPGYVAGATVPSPLTIVLTCTWSDWRGRARTLQLSTARTR